MNKPLGGSLITRTSCTLHLMSFRDNAFRILYELGGCEEFKRKYMNFVLREMPHADIEARG